ncbi:MAG: DegV family protein [Gemmatimonadales bacterium]
MTDVPIGIGYLDGPRLRLSLLAAADWVDAGREELNRINVFPVPDGDTGTNFAATLRAVAEALRALGPKPLPTVTKTMARTCVLEARGNSGMLLSQFLLGFRESLAGLMSASAHQVALAIKSGSDRLFKALDEPVEGTILTVAREAAAEAELAARETTKLEDLMHRVLTRADIALQKTPELLEVLRDAGVVDAGAKAFVRILEGIVRLIDGDPIQPAIQPYSGVVPHAAAIAQVAAERDFHFCTEVLVRGSAMPASTAVRSQLRILGGSIVVLSTDDLLKVHVHTDTPDAVFELAKEWGTIESTKAEDMRQQHRTLHGSKRRIALVVDSSCDLSDEIVDQHGIIIVPLQVLVGSRALLDRVEIGGSELYSRMKCGGERFSTSQPTPAAFAQAFNDATSAAEEVMGIFVSGALSGTLSSAQRTAENLPHKGVTTIDSKTVSLGLGLLVIRAAELIDEGRTVDEITVELARVRKQSGGFFTVDSFDDLLRSGRVSRGRAWLGGLLDIKPILEVDSDGRAVPYDRIRGRDGLIERVIEHLDSRLTPRPRKLRMGVAHAGVPGIAAEIQTELVARYAPRTCLVGDVTAALGVHTGPGAWGIFYQIED